MTGPSAPDPTVETVARVLAEHRALPGNSMMFGPIWTCGAAEGGCGCSFRCGEGEVSEWTAHQGAVVVAALRAAAGTADVDDLADALRAKLDRIPDSDAVTLDKTVVRAVLDRLATTGAEATSNGSGVSLRPTEPTPDVASGPVPVAADDDAAERAPVGWMVLRAHPRDIGHLIDDWDGLDVHATRQDGEGALADANEAVRTHCGRAAGLTAYGLYEVHAARGAS